MIILLALSCVSKRAYDQLLFRYDTLEVYHAELRLANQENQRLTRECYEQQREETERAVPEPVTVEPAPEPQTVRVDCEGDALTCGFIREYIPQGEMRTWTINDAYTAPLDFMGIRGFALSRRVTVEINGTSCQIPDSYFHLNGMTLLELMDSIASLVEHCATTTP